MAMPMISSEPGSGGGGQYYSHPPSSSFRHMLKSSLCCFTPVGQFPHEILDSEPDDGYSSELKPSAAAARSSWNFHDLEIRDRCRRMGRRSGGRHRRRYRSEDFRYDPESYSLNFEDEAHREDELALSSFAARLPATPDRFLAVGDWNTKSSATAGRKEISAWS